MPISQPDLNAALLQLTKHYATAAQKALEDNLVSIALYGFVARGQAGPAPDIDIFVVLQEAPSGMLARRRLLQPVRDSLTVELEALWEQGIYTDFIEVIRSRTEAQQFHPLYLYMSQEAILLYDRDRFLIPFSEGSGSVCRELAQSATSWEGIGTGIEAGLYAWGGCVKMTCIGFLRKL